jgi:hypothetical protein
MSIEHPVDITALRAGAKAIVEKILECKRALRSTWTEPMGDVQYQLMALKREATAHCTLRAMLRGRIHPVQGKAAQKLALSMAERLAAKYRRLEEPALEEQAHHAVG